MHTVGWILARRPATCSLITYTMAQKRMFDKAIIDTDKFMDLSMTAKAMYFLLGMEADDEGFVSYKKVLRIHGGNEDDVKILVAKNFLLQFPSGVVVITDWNANNYLDRNRIRPTEYQTEKDLLALTDTKRYVFNECLTTVQPVERSIEEKRRVENSKYGVLKNVSLSNEEYTKLKERYGASQTNHLIEELSTYIPNAKTKYKNHYATILNWAKRKGIQEVPKVITAQQSQTELTEDQKARIAEMRRKVAESIKPKVL